MAKINDLIFNTFLNRGFKLVNDIRTWDVSDSKLWYLSPEQAQGYLDLEKDETYKNSIIQNEIILIEDLLPEILPRLELTNYNLIDLGCGDGKKASILYKKIGNYKMLRYCPVDISSFMVSSAMQTIINDLDDGRVLNSHWNISDFENLDNITPIFRDKVFGNHFILFLGNTLGNFECESILSSISNCMVKGDFLLVGNGIGDTSKMDSWVTNYKSEHINSWLIKVITQIGLSADDVDYEVQANGNRIEEVYILIKDKKVEHLGKFLDFKKGDKIIVATSYKYSKEYLIDKSENFFDSVTSYSNKDDSYILLFCQK